MAQSPLLHSPANILRYLLIDLAQGTLPSDGSTWPIHVGQEADNPDQTITVYNTEGRTDGRMMEDGEVVEFPGILVRIRSPSSETGYTKAEAIKVALDEAYRVSVTIDSTTYTIQAATRVGTVNSLGRDVQRTKMFLYTLNYLLTVSRD